MIQASHSHGDGGCGERDRFKSCSEIGVDRTG